MNRCKCKLCGEVFEGGELDIKMFRHLDDEHHKEFKSQMEKPIKDLFRDNFERSVSNEK